MDGPPSQPAPVALFIFFSAKSGQSPVLGILRMPDLFMRMSCSTKAGTIVLGTLLLSLTLYFLDFGVATRAVATIGFIFLTAPVGSHRIGRIAYLVGVPLWAKTDKDELKGDLSAGCLRQIR